MTTLLRRVTEPFERNQRVYDLVFVAVIMAFTVTATALLDPRGSEQQAGVFAFVLLISSVTLLFWRRKRPLLVLPAIAVITVIFWISDYSGTMDPVPFIAFFAAARHGGHDRRLVWQVVGAALVLVVGVATVGVIVPQEDLTFFHLLGVILIHVTAVVLGESFYQRSQHVAELELRTAALEADLKTRSELAAVEERTRIAREMHDIIAHGMSTVVVQAQAAQRLVDRDPSGTRDILETIEGIGRDSANEMRRMLGVLRDDNGDTELAPQPTFADCADLIEHAREAGVAATLTTTGDQRPAPPGVELAGYRVIQEALTNVIRHGGRPVHAEVSIHYADESIEIEIADDGLGGAASNETAGSGHGLLGMQERIEVYDGSFDVGPRLAGGFRVKACLPIAARVNA